MEKRVEALINTGCVCTLVHKVHGPFTPELLKMQCIHGDIHEYRMKKISLEIVGQIFTCRVGVVPRLVCAVLVGANPHRTRTDTPLYETTRAASRTRRYRTAPTEHRPGLVNPG